MWSDKRDPQSLMHTRWDSMRLRALVRRIVAENVQASTPAQTSKALSVYDALFAGRPVSLAELVTARDILVGQAADQDPAVANLKIPSGLEPLGNNLADAEKTMRSVLFADSKPGGGRYKAYDIDISDSPNFITTGLPGGTLRWEVKSSSRDNLYILGKDSIGAARGFIQELLEICDEMLLALDASANDPLIEAIKSKIVMIEKGDISISDFRLENSYYKGKENSLLSLTRLVKERLNANSPNFRFDIKYSLDGGHLNPVPQNLINPTIKRSILQALYPGESSAPARKASSPARLGSGALLHPVFDNKNALLESAKKIEVASTYANKIDGFFLVRTMRAGRKVTMYTMDRAKDFVFKGTTGGLVQFGEPSKK